MSQFKKRDAERKGDKKQENKAIKLIQENLEGPEDISEEK